MTKRKKIVASLIVACCIPALLSMLGCATPLTPVVLERCGTRHEQPIEIKSAGIADQRILVSYDAVIRPKTSNQAELARKHRWAEIKNISGVPEAKWHYAAPDRPTREIIAAHPVPLRHNISIADRKTDFSSLSADYVVYSDDYDLAQGFTLFTSSGPTKFTNFREVPPPFWRYPVYIVVVPVTVVYDILSLPFWIQDTILFHDI